MISTLSKFEKLIADIIMIVGLLFIFLLFSRENIYAVESISYIHTDHLGSTILVTDENGEIVTNQVYYPYGDVRNVGVKLPTEKAYTGQVSDEEETGMYYYNARYYNSVSGIFTQADVKEGPNRYIYTRNNPLKYIDPTGDQEKFCYEPQNIDYSYFTSSDEPVNIVNYRESLIRKYNIYIGGRALGAPSTLTNKGFSFSNDFWTDEQLGGLEFTLQLINPEFYKGKSISLGKNMGYASGYAENSPNPNFLVVEKELSNTMFFETILHEFLHLGYAKISDKFIEAAQVYGFRELTDLEKKSEKWATYVEPFGGGKWSRSITYNNISDIDSLFKELPYIDFESPDLRYYSLIDWNELYAVMGESIAFNSAAIEFYKDNFPELYNLYFDYVFSGAEKPQ